MRPILVAAVSLLAVNGGLALAQTVGNTITIDLPTAQEPCRIRLEILIAGRSPAVRWEEFLERLYRHFDSNQDGSLSRDEASRMMPLPLPDRKQLVVNPPGDHLSLPELKAYCREHGFTAIVPTVEPSSPDDLRLSGLLRKWLDENGNGQITASELRQAVRSMSRYDLNEDDSLDLGELLKSAAMPLESASAALPGIVGTHDEDVLLRVDLDGIEPTIALQQNDDGPLASVDRAGSNSSRRFRGPGNAWMLAIEMRRALPNVKAGGDFLIAQFQTALGNRSTLSREDIKQDPTLSGLLELTPLADQDQDDRLTLAEIESYTGLVAAGLQSQVWVTVIDRGYNFFPALDQDADGRLSFLELAQAEDLLEASATTGVPRQYQITFRAAPVRSLGGMAIPALTKARPSATKAARSGPRWFQAIDRNRDDIIAPREFLGPPWVFERLDTNGDGLISLAEATGSAAR